MISRRLPVRQLPVVLPLLADELLSSWINRHAGFYGVTGRTPAATLLAGGRHPA
jgi:hypothetical protein